MWAGRRDKETKEALQQVLSAETAIVYDLPTVRSSLGSQDTVARRAEHGESKGRGPGRGLQDPGVLQVRFKSLEFEKGSR
jgi:hypothetical protein